MRLRSSCPLLLPALLLTCSMLSGASVIYTFTGVSSITGDAQSFTYAASNFITVDTLVSAASLDSCSAAQVCVSVLFHPSDAHATAMAGLDFSPMGSSTYYYLPAGALGTIGTYATPFDFNPGTLTVTSDSASNLPAEAVPEPSTLLLLGVATILIFRRKRKT